MQVIFPCIPLTERKMLIQKDRAAIYEYPFKESWLVPKKDHFCPNHRDVDVENFHVMNAMASLTSMGYVREQFARHHCYWYLTHEGIHC